MSTLNISTEENLNPTLAVPQGEEIIQSLRWQSGLKTIKVL